MNVRTPRNEYLYTWSLNTHPLYKCHLYLCDTVDEQTVYVNQVHTYIGGQWVYIGSTEPMFTEQDARCTLATFLNGDTPLEAEPVYS